MKRALSSVLLLALALSSGCGLHHEYGSRALQPTIHQARPVPTEHWLADDAERENRKGRKRWIEEMHRTAPGVDWKAIEAANGALLTGLRNKGMLPRAVGDWTERGSRNLSGRMHSVALSLDGTRIYGGSSRGGIWRGALDGSSWEPISDNLWGGAHHVAVATGPGEIVLSLTDGGRLAYTADGGQTWLTPAGLPGGAWEGIHIQTDPANLGRVFFLGTWGDYWNPERRLYRSEDGGQTFQLLRDIGAQHSDIWLDRVSGGPVYLLEGPAVLRSDDAGDNWQSVGTVRPGPEPVNKVVLAGSEAGAPTLYAALREEVAPDTWRWFLYQSVDAGANWEQRWRIDDFWETLVASITDSELVLTGGVEVFRSTDGGRNFTLVNGWGAYYADPLTQLHADIPGLDALMVGTDEVFYISTDGGAYRSDDGVANVRNISLEGLGVSQYYSTLTSINDPDLVLGGSQDQGYQRTSDAGRTVLAFDQLISGDYGHLTSSDGTHDWVFSVYPGFVLVQYGEQAPELRQVEFPPDEDYTWMPFILADPRRKDAFYFCAGRLYRYEHQGGLDNWSRQPVSSQVFTHGQDAYALTALSISPVDTDRFIAVNNVGVVYFSDDGGQNWTRSPDGGPHSHYFYGNALAPSPRDAMVAYLGGSGYSGPGVYRTYDGGATWTPVANGLPRTMVYSLVFENQTSDVIYAATEAGPYRLDPGTDTWEHIGGQVAPLTTYWTVEAVPAVGVIRFGTYGRGIWDYQATGPMERCWEDVDNDGDTLTGCDDPDCLGVDADGDGADDCRDCAWRDGTVWAPPGEPVALTVEKIQMGVNGIVAVRWNPGPPGADSQIFDVLAGDFLELGAVGWPAAATCLADDKANTTQTDFATASSRWYLVRGQNACGHGSLGAAPTGERSISTGDCD